MNEIEPIVKTSSEIIVSTPQTDKITPDVERYTNPSAYEFYLMSRNTNLKSMVWGFLAMAFMVGTKAMDHFSPNVLDSSIGGTMIITMFATLGVWLYYTVRTDKFEGLANLTQNHADKIITAMTEQQQPQQLETGVSNE